MDNKDFLVTSLREEELDKIKKYRKYSDFLFLINVILKSTLLVVFVLLYKEYLRGATALVLLFGLVFFSIGVVLRIVFEESNTFIASFGTIFFLLPEFFSIASAVYLNLSKECADSCNDEVNLKKNYNCDLSKDLTQEELSNVLEMLKETSITLDEKINTIKDDGEKGNLSKNDFVKEISKLTIQKDYLERQIEIVSSKIEDKRVEEEDSFELSLELKELESEAFDKCDIKKATTLRNYYEIGVLNEKEYFKKLNDLIKNNGSN